jgi:hypothetical protein
VFQQPAEGGDKTPFKEMIGSLVLIYARDYREAVVTSLGAKDAVAGDVHVLQGQHGGEVFENTLIFNKVMVGSLRPAVGGEPVLGRIAYGVAKPGQNAPIILSQFDASDAAIATAYITTRMTAVQQPAPAVPTAAAPVATPAPAAAPTAPAAPAAASSQIDISTLPPEVVELLRQSGQLPAA